MVLYGFLLIILPTAKVLLPRIAPGKKEETRGRNQVIADKSVQFNSIAPPSLLREFPGADTRHALPLLNSISTPQRLLNSCDLDDLVPWNTYFIDI